MRAPIFVAIALLGGALAWAVGTTGEPTVSAERHQAESSLAQGATATPLQTVLRTIGQRYPGRALGARVTDRDGRQVYRIKWMGDDGRVHEIVADVESGEILKTR